MAFKLMKFRWASFLNWLLRCESPDPETAAKGSWAAVIILCGLGLVLANMLTSLFYNPASMPVHFARIVVLVGAFLLNRQGRVAPAIFISGLVFGTLLLL